LVFWAVCEGNDVFGIDGLTAIESQGNKPAAFDFVGSHLFFLASVQVNPKDDGNACGFLAPSQISLVKTLSESGDSLAALESIDEGLYFLVLEGRTETVEYNRICGRVDQFVLLGVGGVEEEGVFYLSVVVGYVFLDDRVLEG
jgi:hypothetical protein